MIENIKIKISDGIFGQQRYVEFEGVRSMSMREKFGQIVWIVTQFDNEGSKITNPDISQERIVISPISNKNFVNKDGVTVDADDPTAFMPEFDFWWAALQSIYFPLVVKQAAEKLDQLNRFDLP